MTPEILKQGNELLDAIMHTKHAIIDLENKCDISIEGNYKKNTDNPIWEAMREAALKVFKARLDKFGKEFEGL